MLFTKCRRNAPIAAGDSRYLFFVQHHTTTTSTTTANTTKNNTFIRIATENYYHDYRLHDVHRNMTCHDVHRNASHYVAFVFCLFVVVVLLRF